MNLYTGLLFQQGYIQDPQLALSLAGKTDQGEPIPCEPQADEPRRPARPERRASFRRGAIFAVCSTSLSPFR
ncbi:hypothetical protein FCE95_08125 [Luteimonas gilva]|uniref:Uncharacterized protein n=1 Tax=Luteimonas gilva TaxID=2572684 RepID=A0A4U5JKN1_9GAMM|nr:hypothetical protein [Luteimonas gilva]TKR30102.1 hypothetical protein FCE95_08125 [Luteimonas gilva]